MSVYYAVNQTQTNVVLLSGKYLIPIGGWSELRPEHAKHEDVEEGIRRGWIKVTATKPQSSDEFKPEFEIQKAPVHGSKEFPKQQPAAKKAKNK